MKQRHSTTPPILAIIAFIGLGMVCIHFATKLLEMMASPPDGSEGMVIFLFLALAYFIFVIALLVGALLSGFLVME